MGLFNGLFDAFSFKKEASKIFSKEAFGEILEHARSVIIEFAKENMPGEEKKRNVDLIVTSHIYAKVAEANVKNKWVLWLVDRLVDLLPRVTQLIYDCLKEKVKNL